MTLSLAITDDLDLIGPSAALALAGPEVRPLLAKALAGGELTATEAERLFQADGPDLMALLATANHVRQQRVGNRASFVTTRNINFTNVCYMGCRFCNFSKRREDVGAEWLTPEQVADRAEEAWQRGGTEVCIQGGLHPDLPGHYYRDLLRAVKARVPGIHIHAFSPFEIWYGAKKSRLSVADFLTDLKEAGLGSIPGTAAEILDVEIRKQLTRNKLSTEAWVEIIRTAHQVGLHTTATIMYGHIDAPRHWAAHLDLLRTIQKEAIAQGKPGRFTELVPLGFVHEDSPLYQERSDVRPGPTLAENLKMHAVARLMLAGFIDHIQVSWVKLGPETAQAMLRCGADDLGGTLMNESISRAAGAKYGQEITPAEMVDMIRAAGRTPVQRGTFYQPLDTFIDHDPAPVPPLVARAAGTDPLAFLHRQTIPLKQVA